MMRLLAHIRRWLLRPDGTPMGRLPSHPTLDTGVQAFNRRCYGICNREVR